MGAGPGRDSWIDVKHAARSIEERLPCPYCGEHCLWHANVLVWICPRCHFETDAEPPAPLSDED
jgi:ribosomal protein L37AE/L43A